MDFESYTNIFKALSHPTRLQIAYGLLKKGECCVSTMVEKLKLAQPTVSQHLNILKNAQIIQGYRNGNQICYKLKNDFVKNIINTLEVDSCEQ